MNEFFGFSKISEKNRKVLLYAGLWLDTRSRVLFCYELKNSIQSMILVHLDQCWEHPRNFSQQMELKKIKNYIFGFLLSKLTSLPLIKVVIFLQNFDQVLNSFCVNSISTMKFDSSSGIISRWINGFIWSLSK